MTTILHKRGTGKPSADDLSVGELALDTSAGTAYTKLSNGTVVEIGGSGGDSGGGGTSYPFTADGDISAGDPVILQRNGKVTKSAISADAVFPNVTFASDAMDVSVCYDTDSDRYVFFYKTKSDRKGMAVVGKKNGTSMTFGAPTIFADYQLLVGQNNRLTSTYDSKNKQVVVAYTQNADSFGRLRAGTVSDMSISFHNELNVGHFAMVSGVCYDPDLDVFVYNSWNSVQSFQHFDVIRNDGSSLSILSDDVSQGGANGVTGGVAYMEGYGSGGNYAICHNQGGEGYIRIATVNPSTFKASFGTALNVADDSGISGYIFGGNTLAWSKAHQRLLVIYHCKNGNNLNCNMYQVSGSAFSRIQALTVNNATFDSFNSSSAVVTSSDGLNAAVVFPGGSSGSTSSLSRTLSTFTPTTIAFGSNRLVDGAGSESMSAAYDASGSQYVIGLTNNGGGFDAKAAVGASSMADRRNLVVGFSDGDAASGQTVNINMIGSVNANQSGLIPNTEYALSAGNGYSLVPWASGQHRVGVALSEDSILVMARSEPQAITRDAIKKKLSEAQTMDISGGEE